MILDPLLDLFRGRAVTIPPMDGALKPNTALDDARVVLTAPAPDNLVVFGGTVLYSTGAKLCALPDGKTRQEFESPITAAASNGKTLAVALANGRVLVDGSEVAQFRCPTALAFDGGDLLVCNGSEANAPEDWARDLMQNGASGSVWRVMAKGERQQLAKGLAFPSGIIATAGGIVVSESWKHRLVNLSTGPTLARLPAYPGRITHKEDGYLLCLFAPLNRLVEFVLQEDRYRMDMMAEIDPKFWIAPTLHPASNFLEPLQAGGVKSMGVHKPWSPARSCGLVVELDERLQPVASHHSRANGKMHGVTSALWNEGEILAAAKGGNAILSLVEG